MDENEIIEQQPEYYDVTPEFNSTGRLCNYHTGGEGETVRVMADEWERFNRLAGRQHEITGGVVVYNPDLEPCLPDDTEPPDPAAEIEQQITDLQIAVVEQFEENLALREELISTELALVELYEMMIGGAANG